MQIHFDPSELRRFRRTFFRRNTAEVARSLIGAWILRRHEGSWYGARIVETEAYLGRRDAAAHSYGGRRTARVEPMYMDGGHLYVYFIYGMHYCANVVTRREGVPEAVLLRAAEGLPPAPVQLLSGPGRLCAALGITSAASGSDLLGNQDIFIAKNRTPVSGVVVTRRIGIDYAGEARDWPLRFYDDTSRAVSGPSGLRPTFSRAGFSKIVSGLAR